jgi:hypothetical protein
VILDPRSERRGVGNSGMAGGHGNVDVVTDIAEIGVERFGDCELGC